MSWPHINDIQWIGFFILVLGYWIGATLREIRDTLGGINAHLYSISCSLEHSRNDARGG